MRGQQREDLKRQIETFLTKDFSPNLGEARRRFKSSDSWRKFRQEGTELWLDTGNMEDIESLWTQEFVALTTNNTLLNREIQTGRYDSLIPEMAELLESHGELTEKERRLEFAFMLNAWHAMRLVEQFGAYVSVEEHTDLACDVDATVDYARRYHRLCPERFYVKIPFTPAGLLATRRVSDEGVPVNHTLGFSARQNYVIARIARPRFVNVFLGRLNSFVSSNEIGSGDFVGEKATLASQRVVRNLREQFAIQTRQIGASLRNGKQIMDLVGLDVMTMPPKAAQEVVSSNPGLEEITDKTSQQYAPGINADVDVSNIRLDTLWHVGQELVDCVDALEEENLDSFTPDDLIDFFAKHGCGDVLVRWTDEQRATSAEEGKIPKLSNWQDQLAAGKIGLDSLMNLAGLGSFATDQKAMDEWVNKAVPLQVHPSHRGHAGG